MTPSWRKPVGALAILAMLAVWCVLVASLSTRAATWPWWGQVPFFLIAGIAWLWVLPLKRMLFWMEHGRFATGPAPAGQESEPRPADSVKR